jgi:hypothetical protein
MVSSAHIDELSNLIFDTTVETNVEHEPLADSSLLPERPGLLFKLIEKLAELGQLFGKSLNTRLNLFGIEVFQIVKHITHSRGQAN